MIIRLDPASFIPIYEQIKKQIKTRISLGDLAAKSPLPSIRELATDLLINPNTVARAYRELEIEGFIYTLKGKGCYVSGNSKVLIEKEREAILDEIFGRAIDEAKRFNLSTKEIKSIFLQKFDMFMKAERKEWKNE